MSKILIFLFSLLLAAPAFSQEISLFDSDGNPRAYIDTDDEDLTVYLWNGTPVCYLSSGGKSYNIYGFNGKHLGWFKDGLVIDHDGYVVGFKKGAVNKYTSYEPYKPYMPYVRNRFSNEDLTMFLK